MRTVKVDIGDWGFGWATSPGDTAIGKFGKYEVVRVKQINENMVKIYLKRYKGNKVPTFKFNEEIK